jgi:fatty-acid desaturase
MNAETRERITVPIRLPSAIGHVGHANAAFSWQAALWIGSCHVAALAAPFCFTVEALVLAVLLSWLTGAIGVCVGFHRLLTHDGFQTYRPVRCALALLGSLAGEGSPLMWVAAHRQHHQFSDQPGDPHSPRDGFWWSHFLWMLSTPGSRVWAERYRRYVPDLLRDPFLRFLDRRWLWLHGAMGLLLFGIGWAVGNAPMAVSFLVYGLFVRLVYVFHITWLVNSATHRWGYRNYDTTDDSRNLWWVALLTYGEGWHNNHHAHPRLARHGHRWWEVDMNYWFIRGLQRLHMAWNIAVAVQVESASCSESTESDSRPSAKTSPRLEHHDARGTLSQSPRVVPGRLPRMPTVAAKQAEPEVSEFPRT